MSAQIIKDFLDNEDFEGFEAFLADSKSTTKSAFDALRKLLNKQNPLTTNDQNEHLYIYIDNYQAWYTSKNQNAVMANYYSKSQSDNLKTKLSLLKNKFLNWMRDYFGSTNYVNSGMDGAQWIEVTETIKKEVK